MYCSFCESDFDPYEFDSKDKDGIENNEYETTILTCPECGGQIESTDNETTGFCPFCGGSTIFYSRLSKEEKPDYVIPFYKTKEDCKEAYMKAAKRAFFLPKEYKDVKYIDGFRGIYMPFWAYHITGESHGSQIRGSKTTLEDKYDVTREYDMEMDARCEYDGILFDASSTFPDDVADVILPYSVKQQAVPYQPAYFTGFYADTGDIPQDVYEEDAVLSGRQMLEAAVDKELKAYGSAAAGNVETRMDSQKPRFLFLPVWFLSSRNEKTGRVSYAVINGENGRICADLPIDFRKYLLLAFLIAVPAFLLYLLPAILPKTLVWVITAVSVLMLLLVNYSCNKAYIREHGGGDKGRRYKEPETAGRVILQEKKQASAKARAAGGIARSAIGIIGLMVVVVGTLVLTGSSILAGIVMIAVIVGAVWVEGKWKPRRKETVRYKVPMHAKAATLVKPAAGILVCLAISLLAPPSDAWYYGVSLFSILMLCLAVLDLVRHHNLLATRKPVQLGRRGGDENE